jgi:large subunit ribosomal protein L21
VIIQGFPAASASGVFSSSLLVSKAVKIEEQFGSSGVNRMYAVIKTGGKQYRVAPGDTLKVESLAADIGQQVQISEVLAVVDGGTLKSGTPLTGAAVTATVLGHGRHDKVTIFKMQRRKHFQKHAGHRQNFTELRIDSIAA